MSKITKHNQLRLFLMGFGIFIGICGWSMFSQGNKSVNEIDHWTKVESIILESKTETVSMSNPSSAGSRFVTGWMPAITYKFSFKGKKYQNSRYTIIPFESLDFEKVSAIVSSYPKDSRHMVYVNPNNPSESVLSREDKNPSKVHLVVGFILTAIGGGLVIVGALLRVSDGRHSNLEDSKRIP